ncbi:glycosyltransferase [Romboutsia sedimentorum]|uniref:glycosyltransferase n=1 Tax=Romboutsia sedimentorum TaxID=1368474 RepID=UPI0024DE0FA5|nr:glycosyltransferase [Romboutsia sedimentorum]MDK2587405.1 glycosyltransferase [Romboutsia sedimentorum]
MNSDTAMIIDIPFNICNHPFWFEFKILYASSSHNSQTKEWIDYRIDIFMKYTAKSLINQTNQNFKCIVRHTKETKHLIDEALSKYPRLPGNIIFTDDGDNKIKEIISDYKYIYHIRIDSDNMFNSDYIEQLHNIKYYTNLQCILCQRGYIYETNKNILVHMMHPSPSFYALTYTVDSFLSGLRYYVKDDHWGAMNLIHETIPTPSYIVIIHGLNISNDLEDILAYHYIQTSIATEEEKKQVLNEFNLL